MVYSKWCEKGGVMVNLSKGNTFRVMLTGDHVLTGDLTLKGVRVC